MSESGGSSTVPVNVATAEDAPSTIEDPNSNSATPLQGRRKGFPVMPPRDNMIPMLATPKPSSREKLRPRNGPPIDEWEAVLVGKKLVQEDAENNENPSIYATVKNTQLWAELCDISYVAGDIKFLMKT